ncbi:hypothetical protein N658DRAFT_115348 [Parathielavia hyrcaniae]|uniref:Uncharacterized protein n=1 Tax=Parathielavia hyrcaniae TaxID=113614 RepID=A0AAN6Q806_9PEZI|nr:hypothetical protein N658DRAFT_115348 [Parathielavia hyrcaniae]
MKVHAFGLVCLIAGVLAAPIEQAQNLQVKPHAGQHAAAAVEHVRDVPTPEDPEFPEDEPVVDVPEGDVDVPEGDEEGDDEVEDGDVPEDEPFVDAPEVEDETEADVPKNEADVPEGGEEGGEEIDIEAFQQLVSQVQQDVQAVEQSTSPFAFDHQLSPNFEPTVAPDTTSPGVGQSLALPHTRSWASRPLERPV